LKSKGLWIEGKKEARLIMWEKCFMRNKPTLITLLMKVKDKRRAAGRRHQIIHILLIIILGTMSGYEGYRGLESFVERFEEDLIALLKIKRREVPSMSTIRRVMMSIDFNQLSGAFYRWSKSRVKIGKREWMICDGKGIRGSVSNTYNKQQNFVNLVSMYCSRVGVALFSVALNNKEKSEIVALRELIAALDMDGVVISADAIHCQKKR
jgi:hypothetical protein